MATSYTPGLTVATDQVVFKRRRLPVVGQVLVKPGQKVSHDTIVARAELPGEIETVRLAERMQLEPEELGGKVRVKAGDTVNKGDLLVSNVGLFGFFRTEVRSPVNGTVEFFAPSTGHLGIRKPVTPLEINAYVAGRIEEVEENQGVTVRTRGALIQGIFGVGGERQGTLRILVDSPDEEASLEHMHADVKGQILVCGACISPAALCQAGLRGAAGIVVGGIRDSDLAGYLGEEIGVAVTGDENVPATLVLTEGFGRIRMAQRTFDLLRMLEGRFASMNGATQIRAGAVRPEILVPHAAAEESEGGPGEGPGRAASIGLTIGCNVRAVRQPYFGQLGIVTDLPVQPARVASGAMVRVLKMKIADGREVVLPRANVEILAGSTAR